MKILVTGGAGFIGTNLVNQLLLEGHTVLIVDNFSTGKHSNCNDKARYIALNILDDRLAEAFDDFRPEVVFHLSAQVSVSKSISNPLVDAETNILGTIKVLQECVRTGVRKIIFASSAAVYGNPIYLGVDEGHPISPLSQYGLSKQTGEHYIRLYAEMYNLDYTILRFANVYGERQDHTGEGGVISIFINNILGDKQSIIFGDGEQTRDFIYIKDVIRANVAALTNGSRGTFNISTNTSTSINELLDVLAQCSGKEMRAIKVEKREGDIAHSWLDNALAYKMLNWQPEHSIREGLWLTYKWYEQTTENRIGVLSPLYL